MNSIFNSNEEQGKEKLHSLERVGILKWFASWHICFANTRLNFGLRVSVDQSLQYRNNGDNCEIGGRRNRAFQELRF